jgi:spore germination cell wall hydrolase CwlJ-like protein
MLKKLVIIALACFSIGGSSGKRDRHYAEDLLSALVCAECSVCSEDERQAVAATVIHRARSRHPRRLEAVILAPHQYADLAHCKKASRARRRMLPAARLALQGADPADGATHFHARWTCTARPWACYHASTRTCEDTVWPTLQEVAVPAAFRHRFYRVWP